MKLSGAQLPIALSALVTKQRSRSFDTLRDIAIKMYETHRRQGADSSEVFIARESQAADTPFPLSPFLIMNDCAKRVTGK